MQSKVKAQILKSSYSAVASTEATKRIIEDLPVKYSAVTGIALIRHHYRNPTLGYPCDLLGQLMWDWLERKVSINERRSPMIGLRRPAGIQV
jgi:hypothetical protein